MILRSKFFILHFQSEKDQFRSIHELSTLVNLLWLLSEMRMENFKGVFVLHALKDISLSRTTASITCAVNNARVAVILKKSEAAKKGEKT